MNTASSASSTAIESASAQIDRVLAKSRFWHRHRAQVASPEQVKVLNRLLDGDQRGRGGFEHGISAAQYQAVAKVSKATATRHLADLVAKGVDSARITLDKPAETTAGGDPKEARRVEVHVR